MDFEKFDTFSSYLAVCSGYVCLSVVYTFEHTQTAVAHMQKTLLNPNRTTCERKALPVLEQRNTKVVFHISSLFPHITMGDFIIILQKGCSC